VHKRKEFIPSPFQVGCGEAQKLAHFSTISGFQGAGLETQPNFEIGYGGSLRPLVA
jgi:hypothetical protein